MNRLVRLLSIAVATGSLLVVAYVLRDRMREHGSVRMTGVRGELMELLQQRSKEREREERAFDGPVPDLQTGLDWVPLRRHPLSPAHAALLAATLHREVGRPRPRKVFDPGAIFVNAPGWKGRIRFAEHSRGAWEVGYSEAGFRNPYEPSESAPRLRVILCGDSHIEGVVPYEDTAAALLEHGLRYLLGGDSVEVLNGASGGYDFYNYVGFLERSLSWNPDVFILVIFGGNDFVGSLVSHAYFERVVLDLPSRPWLQRIKHFADGRTGLMAQGFQQILHFKERPQNAELALDAAVRAMRDMDALSRAEGIAFLSAYLPPQSDVRPQDMADDLSEVIDAFDLSEEDLRITDRLADRLIAELEPHGIRVLDLRPALRAEERRQYWLADHHLNDHGQRVVARELFPRLVECLPEGH